MFGWLESHPAVSSLIGVLIGVVFGALLTYAIDSWRERHKRAAHASYLARRLVVAIDKFVDGIASAFEAEDPNPGPQGEHPDWFKLPVEFVEPVDVDWRTLDLDDMDDALRISFRDDQIRRTVRSISEFTGEGAKEAYQEGFSELAVHADSLARRLRKKYKIAPLRADGEWNPLETVQRVRAIVEQRQALRAASDGEAEI